MNFKQWLENREEKLKVFLDLDETLVNTVRFQFNGERLQFNDIEEMEKLGGKIIGDYISFLRPHTIDFIKELQKKLEVYILTSGKKDFQKQIIKIHNIPINDSNIFTREDYYDKGSEENNIPKFSNSILVDDNTHGSSGINDKLYALGAIQDRNPKINYGTTMSYEDPVVDQKFINVKPFYINGPEDLPSDDNELLKTLHIIMHKYLHELYRMAQS